MNRRVKVVCLLVMLMVGCHISLAQNLIPAPKEINYLSDKKVRLKSVEKRVVPTDGLPTEQYTLRVKNGKAVIIAQSKQAECWGVATLRQITDKSGCVPEVEITDYPSFPIRGFMHDTGRNFREVALLKQDIDLLSAYKLNVFHWHLTDNPAWRIECKAYPQLNDAKYHIIGRDEGRFYSYDEIRDVIAYARERGVMIIPEIDMPGHSQYFNRTFGFEMATEEGMKVLEKCLKEFFTEIPKEDCPYIHIGSDEVKVADPEEFMRFCEKLVRDAERTPIAWDPGLPPSDGTYGQIWYASIGDVLDDEAYPRKYIDSYMGYLNNSCPLINTSRYFLHKACNTDKATDTARGGILCLWNDVNVDDPNKLLPHNGMPEGLLAFAECFWVGGEGYGLKSEMMIPAPESAGHRDLVEFEKRLAYHRDNMLTDYDVRWVANASQPWRVTLPAVAGTPVEQMKWTKAWGGVIDLHALCRDNGIKPNGKMDAWLKTEIYVERDTVIKAMVGFESPSRANRISSGIGEQGCWEGGGRLIVNGVDIYPAEEWREPAKYKYLYNTWHKPANEEPYTDEQLFWMREPALVPLKAGWNSVMLYAPRLFNINNWVAAFIPVRVDDKGALHEAEGVKFR
ncbi:MAG: family 20 glycosylhydrolase [Alistipes sp.]|nr:family 20 glycosylhydrolase [Alistipes sp.]